MSYTKRLKAHWNVGKGCKGNRKAKEKEYTDAEIEEQIASEHPDYRTKHYSHTPNRVAQAEHQIQWYRDTIESYRNRKMDSFASWLHTGLARAEKQLEKIIAKSKKTK